ncbi:MAG: PCYCGC motif-containing (lipo)protein [Candidatus Methanoperedens sp.]
MKPEKKAKKLKVSKKKGNSRLIIGVVAVIVLALVAYTVLSGDSNTKETKKTGMTLKELRAQIDEEYTKKGYMGTNTPPVIDDYIPVLAPKTAGKLPEYVYTNAMTLSAYRYATEHPEVLEQLPCYCGCGQHGSETSNGKPHRFLRDCFINDKGQYDSHASTCDVCIGLAMRGQNNFPSGITKLSSPIPDATTIKTSAIDIAALSLTDNFKSLADGLNLTPSGVNRAYFINTKRLIGTEMEVAFLEGQVQPDSFYGKKLIGMYSADFSPTSWIEMHDLGYDSTKDTGLRGRNEQGMKNIVYTRPLIYGHSQNVDNVLKLMKDQKNMSTSYQTYKPLLDAVDYQNAAYALVMSQPNKFSDINYMSLTPVNGKVELVKAYNITDNKSIQTALSKYNPQTKGKILILKVTGDLATVQAEADNIDAAART